MLGRIQQRTIRFGLLAGIQLIPQRSAGGLGDLVDRQTGVGADDHRRVGSIGATAMGCRLPFGEKGHVRSSGSDHDGEGHFRAAHFGGRIHCRHIGNGAGDEFDAVEGGPIAA